MSNIRLPELISKYLVITKKLQFTSVNRGYFQQVASSDTTNEI